MGKPKEKKAEKPKEEEVEAAPSGATPPEGCQPMMISMKNMDAYGLKTGSGLKDTVKFKWFDKAWILEEVDRVGFYCNFNDFKKEIKELPLEKVLVVADPEEKYGQNWLICLTPEATDMVFGELEAERLKEEEAARIQEEEERKKREAEEAERNVVFDDKALCPRPYSSETAMETATEIRQASVLPSRRPLKLKLSRRRKEFGAPFKFTDRDADSSEIVEFRQHKDPNFDLKRRVQDRGLQGCPSWTAKWKPQSAWAQSKPFLLNPDRKLTRSSTQKLTRGSTSKKSNISDKKQVTFSVPELLAHREIPLLVDGHTQTSYFRNKNRALQCSVAAEAAEEKLDPANSDDFTEFLRESFKLVTYALEQNAMADMFAEEFKHLNVQNVLTVVSKGEDTVKELRTFTDLVYSKSKAISRIDWHPRSKTVVAVACTENRPYDQKVDAYGKETDSYILIWNFADLIHPQMVLQCPFECSQFGFNPGLPYIIAGGCASGQVVYWDVSNVQQKRSNKDSQSGKVQESKADSTPPPVSPKEISSIDNSHKRPITDLHWLPANLQINSRGKVEQMQQKTTNQFITCSNDGQLLFWDIGFKDKQGANRKVNTGEGRDASVEEFHWIPLFKVYLTKLDNSGDLGICKMSLRGRQAAPPLQLINLDENAKTVGYSTLLSLGTDEGEIALADWSGSTKVVGAVQHSGAHDLEPSAGVLQATEKLLWIGQDHFSSCVALERSPFFPDVLLSLCDTGLNLWKEGIAEPILQSPLSTGPAHFTCAAWSPTRPAVLILAKMDGTLDIWDFIDQSHKPVSAISVSSCAITSIQFRHRERTSKATSDEDDSPVLALGDENGNLHVVAVPPDFCRPSLKEKEIMGHFLERELRRLDSVRDRANESMRTPRRTVEAFGLDMSLENMSKQAYNKLLEQEENRYQNILKRMLPEAATKDVAFQAADA